MLFADRLEAGRHLAQLEHLRTQPVVVLGLYRGGVPVAFEVARALASPLDVVVVRKLRGPFQPELGMGAMGEDGIRIIDDEIVGMAGVFKSDLRSSRAHEPRRARAPSSDTTATGLAPRSPVTPRSSSMTAWPPAPPPELPAKWHRPQGTSGWCSQCPWRQSGGPLGSVAIQRVHRARHAGAVLGDRSVLRRLLPDLRR